MAYVESSPFTGPFRSLPYLSGLGAITQAQANSFIGKYAKISMKNGNTWGPATVIGVTTDSVVIQDSAGFKETYKLSDVASITEVQKVVVQEPVYINYGGWGYPGYYGGYHGGHRRHHHGHHGLGSYYTLTPKEEAINPVAIIKDPETWKVAIPLAILIGLLYFLTRK